MNLLNTDEEDIEQMIEEDFRDTGREEGLFVHLEDLGQYQSTTVTIKKHYGRPPPKGYAVAVREFGKIVDYKDRGGKLFSSQNKALDYIWNKYSIDR